MPPPTLDLHDIQGLFARGYGSLKAAAFLLLGVEDSDAARNWLRAVTPAITRADTRPAERAVNLAFTSSGLERLGLGPETLAIPVPAVKAVLRVRPGEVRATDGGESIEIDGEQIELVRLDRMLRLPSRVADGLLAVVTLRTGRKTLAVVVDDFFRKEEIVVKTLGAFLQGVGPFSGATVTGEGRVILLLDALKLLELTVTAPVTRELETTREPDGGDAPDGKRCVLLVDDSVSVRKFVGGMLERAGFRVLAARDGAEALQQLAESTVDIVVTDLEMPRLNGYELIRDLNREPATCDLPIVVLTTRAGAKHTNLAKALGVEHYVAKPVDEANFVRLIESLATPSPARMRV